MTSDFWVGMWICKNWTQYIKLDAYNSHLWMALARTSLMDTPFYRVLQVAHAYSIYITISIVMSVCQSGVRPSVRHKNFFSLKSPWNHPLTPGVDPG